MFQRLKVTGNGLLLDSGECYRKLNDDTLHAFRLSQPLLVSIKRTSYRASESFSFALPDPPHNINDEDRQNIRNEENAK